MALTVSSMLATYCRLKPRWQTVFCQEEDFAEFPLHVLWDVVGRFQLPQFVVELLDVCFRRFVRAPIRGEPGIGVGRGRHGRLAGPFLGRGRGRRRHGRLRSTAGSKRSNGQDQVELRGLRRSQSADGARAGMRGTAGAGGRGLRAAAAACCGEAGRCGGALGLGLRLRSLACGGAAGFGGVSGREGLLRGRGRHGRLRSGRRRHGSLRSSACGGADGCGALLGLGQVRSVA